MLPRTSRCKTESCPRLQSQWSSVPQGEYLCSTRSSKKLSEKYLGPFTIISKPGAHSFTLQLPDSMHSVHPVFHVSQLEPCVPNSIPNRVQPPTPPIEVDGEPEYEIKEILDSKIDRRRRHCQLLYLVRWLSYQGTDDETSWLTRNGVGQCEGACDRLPLKVPK